MTSRTNARYATFACYAIFIALGAAGALLGPTYQSLTTRFEMRLEDAAIFTSLQFIGSVIGILIGGRLLDRINARYTLASGAVLLGAGLIVLSSTTSLPLALGGTFIFGLGFGFLDVGPNVVVSALNPERPGAALNLLNVFYGVGAILGPQLVNFAIQRQNFMLAYLITALFTFGMAIVLAQTNVQVRSEETRGTPIRVAWIALLPFIVLYIVYVGLEVGFGSWITPHMTLVGAADIGLATLTASIFFAGLTAGRMGGSVILRRMSNETLMVLSLALVTAGVIPVILIPQTHVIALIAAFVVGFGCGPIFPTGLAIVGTRYPESRGTSSSILAAAGSGGAVFLPWLQGQIGAGVNGGMVLTLGLGILSLVIMIGLRNRRG